MPLRRLGALLVVVLVALAACSGGSGDESASTTTRPATSSPTGATKPALEWHDCDEGQCATLSVPLDDADPQGEQIDLALARVPAKDPNRRIGSLLVNPGGPGAPGVDFVKDVAESLPGQIADRFDVVGWDPRGSGKSSPVDCGDRLDYLFDVDTAPDDVVERQALDEASKKFAGRVRAGGAATSCRTSPRSTPCTTWSGSAPRSATTSSPTSGSRTAPTSARSTRRSTPTRSVRWCSTAPSTPRFPIVRGVAAAGEGLRGVARRLPAGLRTP